MLNRFRFQMVLRILLLAGSMAGTVYVGMHTTYYVSTVLLLLLVIYQVVRLIHYAEQTNRRLSRFLNSIRYSDFSRSFVGGTNGGTFQELDDAFEQVVAAFKQQRVEKQVQYRYMRTVVQHIGIGLISFDQQGDVELINTAAKRLFQLATLRNIEQLNTINPALVDAINDVDSAKRNVVQIAINDTVMQLAMHATTFRLQDDVFKLVSFQDINAALEDKEMEAWQNITKVMAHEIMNSVTPIASLSDTVRMLLRTNTRRRDAHYIINSETVHDVREALETIENRSRGLIRFVNSYRDFTKVPAPDFKLLSMKDLLRRVQNLNKGEAQRRNVHIEIAVEPRTLELTADPHLVEQVLINLIKNAFRALESQGHGCVRLRGEIGKNGHVAIRVEDDGPGIKAENLDKIFILFYSTGQPYTQGGSGIGLSLSRQIMRAHGGTLTVQSKPGEGCRFTLQF